MANAPDSTKQFMFEAKSVKPTGNNYLSDNL